MRRTLWLVCLCCVVNAKEKAKSNNFKGPKSPRAVNLALETLLKFDDKDRAQSLRVLDNIQRLLTKLRDALIDEHVVSRASEVGFERNEFSDFARKAIDVLVTYTDRDLENFAKVSANEVGGCSGSVCTISELNDDDPIKKIFTKRQQQISKATGKDIRAALKKIHHKLEYDTGDKNNEFIQYIDNIYKSLDKNKLKQFINQLQMFKARRNKASLKNIMKENLQRAVFEPVKKLKAKTRRDLIMKLNAFCDEDIKDDSDRRTERHGAASNNENEVKRHGSKNNSNKVDKQSKVLYLRKRPRRYTTTERLITHEIGATINIGKDIDFRARRTDRSSEDENKHKVPRRRHMSGGEGGDHAGSDSEAAEQSAADDNFRRNLGNLGTKEEASKEKKTTSPERLQEKNKKEARSDEESGPDGTTLVAPPGDRNMIPGIAESEGEGESKGEGEGKGKGEGDGNNTNESDGEKPAVVERADHENEISKESKDR